MKYKEELEELNESEEFQAYMTVEEDRERILNTEKIRSFREGVEQEKLVVIKNLQEMDLSNEQIAKAVNLSQEELEKIINGNHEEN